MAEKLNRPYRRTKDWIAFYEGMYVDEPITNESVSRRLGIKLPAARKLTSRHVATGILVRPKHRSLYQTFRISQFSKNVTHYPELRNQDVPIPPLENQYINKKIELNVNNGRFCQSLQIREHSVWVCDTLLQKPKASTSAERRRSYRKRLKAQQSRKCSCFANSSCIHCYNTRFLPITAFDALHTSARHAKLLLFPDRRHFAALDSMPDTPILVHRTFFEFYSPYFSPELFERIPRKNKAYRNDFILNGVRIHYEVYKGGLVILKPSLSRTPLLPSQLKAFMLQLQEALPFYSPPFEEWRIATSDVHFDAPTSEPRKPHSTFYVNGTKFQCYNKNLKGGRRILRLEAQISPGCTIAEYPAVVEAARLKLMEVLGKH